MCEIADDGKSKGKDRVDCDDRCMDIGDKFDDDLKDINKLGKQNSQQETHASDDAYESDASLGRLDTVGGDFKSDSSGYHIDARNSVEDDGAGQNACRAWHIRRWKRHTSGWAGKKRSGLQHLYLEA